MKSFQLLAAVIGAAECVLALSPAGWRSQSIYQVMTDRFALSNNSTTAYCNLDVYCGGTWRGIINQLPYIQNMGFTAVWISPVVEGVQQNTADGPNYHGYWAQNIYEVNTNFGKASDLVALSKALHARGMYLMVDVVTNHMGSATPGNAVDYSIFHPFNSSTYFHPFCLIDYNNQTSIEVCWEGDNVVSLPDLRTENTVVLNMWTTWIKSLVANYTIDGIRLDSGSEVDKAFYKPFQAAANMYIVSEVFNVDPSYTCPYQNYVSGVMNYPAWYWVTQAFRASNGSMSSLVNGINTMKLQCADTTLLGSFLENHDNPRFPALAQDMTLAKNAIAYTLLADGIPIVYQGQEQHLSGNINPQNREAIWLTGYNTSAPLYKFITSLNQIRTRAIKQDAKFVTSQANAVYSDASTIVMRKGNNGSQIVSVLSNYGAAGPCYTLVLPSTQTGFTPKQALVEVLSCTPYTTDAAGNLAVSMSAGLPRIFYPTARLTGSTICASVTSTKSSTSAGAAQSCPTAGASNSTCTRYGSVAVHFADVAPSSPAANQTVKVVGSVPALQNWTPAAAAPLLRTNSTGGNIEWSGAVPGFVAGTVVQYKYVRVAADGSLQWEADPNHTLTVPACVATATVRDVWQPWS